MPWCQSRLVAAEGSQLHVFVSAVVTLNIRGEKFELSVVVIDPLASEAFLVLDVLTQCTVDLSHKQLIVDAGYVMVVTWAWVLPDIYAGAEGTQHPRASADISGNVRVPVLQLICKTSMASLYLYRHLLHSIMVFK